MENREAPGPGPHAARIDAALNKRMRMAERPLQPRTAAAANTPHVPHSPPVTDQLDEENVPPPSGNQRTPVQKASYAEAAKAKRAAKSVAAAAAKRAAERDAVGDREENILEATHDASGSTIRANSRRIATLGPGPARDEAKRDIEADIDRYVKVEIESQAACVRDYAERADVQMLVCGGCGLRDPDEAEGMATYGPVDLATISSEHWLRVGADALERMRAAPTMRLLRVAPDTGQYVHVDVHRELFHNTAEIDGNHYHVVPEAVHDRTHVHLCPHCRRGFNPAHRAVRPHWRIESRVLRCVW